MRKMCARIVVTAGEEFAIGATIETRPCPSPIYQAKNAETSMTPKSAIFMYILGILTVGTQEETPARLVQGIWSVNEEGYLILKGPVSAYHKI